MMHKCHYRKCTDCANNSRLEWSDYEQKWKLKEQSKMMITYEYDGYRASLLPETNNDIACHWRTYIVSKNGLYKEFHLENEHDKYNDEFKRRFHAVVELMIKEKEQPKMTREEAVTKIKQFKYNPEFLNMLEALGLLKFDEPKKEVESIFVINNDGSSKYIWGDTNRNGKKIGVEYGTVKLELWPEGLVLWVGGVIVWKSWIDYYKKGDAVTVEYYAGSDVQKRKQAGIIN